MAEQQAMIGLFSSVDHEIRSHFLIVANAMLSAYGGWNSKIEKWANDAAVLRDSTGELELQTVVGRREIARITAISDDELQRFNGVIDSFEDLIAIGNQIAAEIDAGRVDDANLIYFEAARPRYVEVHGDVYTLVITAERRVATMARTPCG